MMAARISGRKRRLVLKQVGLPALNLSRAAKVYNFQRAVIMSPAEKWDVESEESRRTRQRRSSVKCGVERRGRRENLLQMSCGFLFRDNPSFASPDIYLLTREKLQ